MIVTDSALVWWFRVLEVALMPTVAERAAALHGLVFWLVTVGKGQVWGAAYFSNT